MINIWSLILENELSFYSPEDLQRYLELAQKDKEFNKEFQTGLKNWKKHDRDFSKRFKSVESLQTEEDLELFGKFQEEGQVLIKEFRKAMKRVKDNSLEMYKIREKYFPLVYGEQKKSK